MTAVIKSGSAIEISVRGFAVAPPPPVPTAEARLIAELERRLEAVQGELADREQKLELLATAAAVARSEGHAKGLVEGKQIAEDRSAALARTIAEAAAKSAAQFRDCMERLEDEAASLAALALDRIVGRTASRQDLIVDTVRRAIEGLFSGSVIAVEVSREDFVDAALLDAVLPRDCEVHLVEGLSSGACRLRLRMGEVDLDLQGQAARLRAILDPAEAANR